MVQVTAASPLTFVATAPGGGIQIAVIVVRTPLDAISLRRAVDRELASVVGAPVTLSLNSQPERWLYDEGTQGDERVFAACAVGYGARRDVALLAMLHVGSGSLVQRDIYLRAGGRNLLCGIADSFQDLQLTP